MIGKHKSKRTENTRSAAQRANRYGLDLARGKFAGQTPPGSLYIAHRPSVHIFWLITQTHSFAALATFHAICYQYSRYHRPKEGDVPGYFVLSMHACRLFGLNRQTRRRGLKKLEEIGVIRVRRRPSKNPLVSPNWFSLPPDSEFVKLVERYGAQFSQSDNGEEESSCTNGIRR